MSAIKRWNRSTQVDQSGELRERNAPELEQDLEVPPVDLLALQFQKRFQDGFDSANNDQALEGVGGAGKRPPVELALFDKVLTTEDFEQRLQETLDGTSERAQQVKQIESVYEVYFKDTEDFPLGNDLGGPAPAVTSPELPRYEAPAETAWKGRAMTVPEFQAVTDPSEAAHVQQANQAAAALQESLLAAREAEQPLSLLELNRSKVRA